MKLAIYIETTIVSYIAARPSRQPFLLGCQRLTRRWWREKRRDYELFSSLLVAEEASHGEPLMARRRLHLLRDAKLLEETDAVVTLAAAIRAHVNLPERAVADAAHIAMAAVHGIELLMTWNCTHIANPHIQRILRRVCGDSGYELPALITPIEMLPKILPLT